MASWEVLSVEHTDQDDDSVRDHNRWEISCAKTKGKETKRDVSAKIGSAGGQRLSSYDRSKRLVDEAVRYSKR